MHECPDRPNDPSPVLSLPLRSLRVLEDPLGDADATVRLRAAAVMGVQVSETHTQREGSQTNKQARNTEVNETKQ